MMLSFFKRLRGNGEPEAQPVEIIVRPANSIAARDHLFNRLQEVEGHIKAYTEKHALAEGSRKAAFAAKLQEFRAERDAIRRALGTEN